MATCKDCFHYEACKGTYCEVKEQGDFDEEMYAECGCDDFKNKADFVEVVRCPDCIYCENMKCTELKDNTGHPLDVAIFDYCSYGAKMDGGKEE